MCSGINVQARNLHPNPRIKPINNIIVGFTLYETGGLGPKSLYNPSGSALLEDVDEYKMEWRTNKSTLESELWAVGFNKGMPSQMAHVSSSPEKPERKILKFLSYGIPIDNVKTFICASEEGKLVITGNGSILFECASECSIRKYLHATKGPIYQVSKLPGECEGYPPILLYSKYGEAMTPVV